MKIFVLTRLELRLAWNSFKLRLKSRPNILLYVLILILCIVINSTLHMFLNLSPRDVRLQAFSSVGVEEISAYLMIFASLTILLVSSSAKGFYGKLSTLEFRGPDLEILRSAPLEPYQVFIAKSLKVFIKRSLLTFMAELTLLTPIMTFFGMTADRGIVFLSAILLYSCFLYFVEAFTFLASRLTLNLIRGRARTPLVVPLVTFPLFFYEETLNLVNYLVFLPSTAISKIVYFSLFHSVPMSTVTYPMLSFLALFSGLSMLVIVLSALYYEKVETFEELVKADWLKFLKNKLKWSFGSRHSPVITVFLKEFWTNLRASDAPLIVLDYAILLFIYVLNLSGVASDSTGRFPASSLILAFSILLFSFIFQPSVDVFLAERERSWILKVAPVSIQNVVLAKYLYSLILSLMTLLPPFIGIAFLAPFQAERLILSVSSVSLLLVTNATGIYIGAHYTPASLREEFPVTGIFAYMGLISILASPIVLIPLLFLSHPIALVLVLGFALDYAIVLSHHFLEGAAKSFSERDDL